ncbi:MAG: iron-containing alcohol dehydrogenase [Spirochaetales bacterium]|uniref:Iron-containing alcohol dehydrogenase n=1 Tax=Candidatus Thalassospirochaeta sargassi TaxID=3119039 RepID=A0AAJ1MI62_9SPIO|nr:iron-containing alcohol dehydrogenase [Spirochaetales bacterium]
MLNFDYQSGTKVIFGRGVIDRLGEEVSELGKKALFVYGRDSIKRSGLHEKICAQLQEAGVEIVEHAGVSANPLLSHVQSGVDKARKIGADFIIGAGGGSVIDESKGIAAGTANDAALWDLYSGKVKPTAALPVVAIQTLPATSSETNQVGVATNDETGEKFGLRSPLLVPVKAFLDPELTFTIPLKYTAYACFDMMTHMIEGYFTTTAEFAPVHDGFVEGLAKAVKKSLARILKNPNDYDARAAVMWAGTLAWNGLSNAGLEGAKIPSHMFEHPLSGLYNVAHGAGLAVVMPAWLEYKKHEVKSRIVSFGKNILEMQNLSEVSDELAAADLVIAEFRSWLQSIGCPSSLADLGIDNPDYKELVHHAMKLSEIWNIPGYSEADMTAIYKLCAKGK